MIVSQLWRFPVKSLGGEQVDAIEVGELGLAGDRRWGLLDRSTGLVLTAKREARLLFASARLTDAGGVIITLPDGSETDASSDLAAWLDRDVVLQPAGDEGGVFENPMDFEHETDWFTWQGPPGAYHDMGNARVSLVSTTTLGKWDARRFRTNVSLHGDGEDALVGRAVQIGSCRLQIETPIARCVMVTRAQPGVERELAVLREINRDRAACLGVGSVVIEPGRMQVGDALEIVRG